MWQGNTRGVGKLVPVVRHAAKDEHVYAVIGGDGLRMERASEAIQNLKLLQKFRTIE